jgi:hypothetical protein
MIKKFSPIEDSKFAIILPFLLNFFWFVVYLTKFSVYHRMVDCQMNWNRFRIKPSSPNRGNNLAFPSMDSGKRPKTSARIVDIPHQIRTERHPHTIPEPHL